jgi:hypothetical protein
MQQYCDISLDTFNSLCLPFKFFPGTLSKMVDILFRLQSLFRDTPNITHSQTFKHMEPLLSLYYEVNKAAHVRPFINLSLFFRRWLEIMQIPMTQCGLCIILVIYVSNPLATFIRYKSQELSAVEEVLKDKLDAQMANDLAQIKIHGATLEATRTSPIRSELTSLNLRGADPRTILDLFWLADIIAELPYYFVDSIDLPQLVSIATYIIHFQVIFEHKKDFLWFSCNSD